MKLEVKELSVKLNGKEVLKDISLNLFPGITALVGENSSGKTTLLKSIAGLIKPQRGDVLLDGRSILQMKPRERAKLIGYCWQNPYYGFFEENVRREVEFILRNTGLPGREEILDILGVKKLLDRNPFKLSGGEARRVSLASVLVADQPVVLMDEPFNDMDLDGYLSIFRLLNLYRREGKIVVVALNNALTLDALSPDRVVLIRKGEIVKDGRREEISEDEMERYNIVTRRALIESAGGNH